MEKTCAVLAERHAGLMEGVRGLLETLFDSVVMVADEVSLLTTLTRLKPDMAFIDLSFPITQCANVAALLHRHDSRLKFILLSDYEEPEVIERCMSFGSAGYVFKRFAARDLVTAVQAVKAGRTFVSSRRNAEEEII